MRFSENLLADVAQMWSLPFMLNAFRAGLLVGVIAGVTGCFMVTRRESFAGHTLSVVGFPGAAGAVWLGLSAALGYYVFTAAAALAIAAGARSAGRRGSGSGEQSAVVGTVQAVALACGFLFVALQRGFLGGLTALLFGSFLGITADQVDVLAVVAVLVLVAMAVIGRPLLFASLDPDVARARQVPVRRLDVGFLLVLAGATAAVAQLTGALLVFALLVLPAATAQRLTARPGRSIAVSVVLAVAVTWTGLTAAFYSPYPVGFWLTSIAFAVYVLVVAAGALGRRRGHGVRPGRRWAGRTVAAAAVSR